MALAVLTAHPTLPAVVCRAFEHFQFGLSCSLDTVHVMPVLPTCSSGAGVGAWVVGAGVIGVAVGASVVGAALGGVGPAVVGAAESAHIARPDSPIGEAQRRMLPAPHELLSVECTELMVNLTLQVVTGVSAWKQVSAAPRTIDKQLSPPRLPHF